MEPCSRVLLLAAALFNIFFIRAQDVCPFFSSSCGTIRYPFKLNNQTAPNNCTYFNLACSNTTTGTAMLSLPLPGGDFCVQAIDFALGYIQLYDPVNCLVQRLMAANFSSLDFGPFKAIAYQDYMFHVCPLDSPALGSDHVYVLACLSNSTSNITIATHELSNDLMGSYSCTAIGTWRIPIPAQEDDGGFNHDYSLYLTWDAVECKDCEENNDDGKESGKSFDILKATAYSMPFLFLLALSCCSGFFFHLVRILDEKNERDNADTATLAPPSDATTLAPPLPSATTNNSHGLGASKNIGILKLWSLRRPWKLGTLNHLLTLYPPHWVVKRLMFFTVERPPLPENIAKFGTLYPSANR